MIEIKSHYCMFNECKDQAKYRGLCRKHYDYYVILVHAIKTTWEELENKGLVLKRIGKGGRKNCTTKCTVVDCNRHGINKNKLCCKCYGKLNVKIQQFFNLEQINKFLEDNKLTNIKIRNCSICNKFTLKVRCDKCIYNNSKLNISPNLCIYKKCNNKITSKGLCKKHYNICQKSVKNNEITWEELEKEGLVLKSKKRKLD